MKSKALFQISIITPIFNAASVLEAYFAGIEQTNYSKDKITIIMPDGGSQDRSREIAKAHGAVVIENPLKTAEAGKAVGIKHVLSVLKDKKIDPATHLICLLDSDNIIENHDWFQRMIEPFSDDEAVIGTEPWEYTYRKKDGYITRYTAMLGMSDPICHFLGNYDRLNTLTGRWTDMPITVSDKDTYFVWDVDIKVLPTIGANGTIFRASFFQALTIDQYLFDIEVLAEYVKRHPAKFAKVKIGVVHLFSGSLKSFIRKQKRRIQDYTYYKRKGFRKYWDSSLNKKGLVIFILSCLTIVPLLWHVIKGYSKKPDIAWLFHPVACWITLWIYGVNTVLSKIQEPSLADRSHWTQG